MSSARSYIDLGLLCGSLAGRAVCSLAVSFLSFFFLRRANHKAESIIAISRTAPTTIPATAPDDKPLECVPDEDFDVADGSIEVVEEELLAVVLSMLSELVLRSSSGLEAIWYSS